MLCEKPVSVNHQDAVELLEFSKNYPNLKVMEAFMYRFHPQWKLVKDTITKGEIGEIKHVHSTFSYFNNNPENIKNQEALGGGGLLDIGCYCVNFSRFIYDDEPYEIDSHMDFDPSFNTDRVASGLLKFKAGSASFMCGMQVEFDQKLRFLELKEKLKLTSHLMMPWNYRERSSSPKIEKLKLISLNPVINICYKSIHFRNQLLITALFQFLLKMP